MTRFLRRNIHTVLYTVAAFCIAIYEAYHAIFGEKLEDRVLLSFATYLLAGLGLVIMFERLLESKSAKDLSLFADEIRSISREMQKRLGIVFIDKQKTIYTKVAVLFSEAQNTIKMLIVEVAAPAPEEFGEQLATFLAQHSGVTCDVTIAVSHPDEAFWTANDKRLEIYERRGLIGKQLFLHILEVPRPIVGFNVAVVDNKHCFIGFPPIPAAQQSAEAALIFDNKPKIAEKLSKWLDKIPGKKLYSEARPR
ncbi:MAG: hypothetical protein WA672_05450 [Candidatus Angelobacter sp.]